MNNKVGRPKKKGAIKAGVLQSGLCRFSFIADVQVVDAIKKLSKGKNMSIKDFMKDLLYNIPTNENDIKASIERWKINQRAIKKRSDKIPKKL